MAGTRGFDPELIEAIKGWSRLTHSELAILTQALFTLATHGDSPQWIRDSAESIAADLRRPHCLDAAKRTDSPSTVRRAP